MGVKFGISLTLRDRMRVYETNGTRCSARECRRLYNRELPALYCSPNITRMITAIRVRWVGHVARMGERRG